MAQNLTRQLTEEEYDKIDQVLARVKGGAISNVEALDGFLTALVICPELVKPSEYLKLITSGETEDHDPVFESTTEAERFFGLLMRHWNVINDTLRRGEIYLPVLDRDDAGIAHGNDWANGFIKGTHLRYSVWGKVVNSETRGGPFVPIFALAHEHDPDPSLRPYKEPISREQREELLAGMIAAVKRLYDGFEEERKQWAATGFEEDRRHWTATAGVPGTFRSSAPKVGRNETCPCGSGKKFKKCCGQLTIH